MRTQTESLPFFLFCFSRKLWPLSYFFGSLYRSYLSNEKKKEKRRLSVYWLMHDQHRIKKHVKIRNIERGIANPPLYAFLGWPSSYQSKVLFRYYTYVSTNGASPRWADARLGCARARNFRGNRQIEAVNATLVRYCQGFIKNKSRLNEDKAVSYTHLTLPTKA